MALSPVIVLLAVLSAVVSAQALSHHYTCIKPKITVPGAININDVFYVKEGPVEVFCSSDTYQLDFIGDGWKGKNIVNSTTVATTVYPRSSEKPLKCAKTDFCADYAFFSVNNNNNITGFQCFSNHFVTLNCFWSSNSRGHNYSLSLSLTQDRHFITPICKGVIGCGEFYLCLWDLAIIKSTSGLSQLRIPVQLQMCNMFDCVNKKIDVDLMAMTKFRAPDILGIQSDGQNSAVLKWKISFDEPSWDHMELYYVVEYWFLDIEPQIIVSNTTESFQLFGFSTTNHLKLPCPGKQYRLRVAARLARAAPEYMSDFSYVSFETEPDPAASALDPICDY